jgi:hypothetical protein
MGLFYGSILANARKAPYNSNETLANSNGPSTSVKKRKAKGKPKAILPIFQPIFSY